MHSTDVASLHTVVPAYNAVGYNDIPPVMTDFFTK